jgi:CRP/FNR family transcriptional regulator
MTNLNAVKNQFCLTSDIAAAKCTVCPARRKSVCSFFDQDRIDEVRQSATTRLFHKGTTFYEEGDDLDKIYVLINGMVRLLRLTSDGDRSIVGFVGPGDYFGGLGRTEVAGFTAEAATDTVACWFEKKSFMEKVRLDGRAAFELLMRASDEIEAQKEHALILGAYDAQSRLAVFLLQLMRRWRPKVSPVEEVRIPMSRGDIADYLGLTNETISRAFSALKSEGVIELPSKSLAVVLDRKRLLEIASVECKPEPARGS